MEMNDMKRAFYAIAIVLIACGLFVARPAYAQDYTNTRDSSGGYYVVTAKSGLSIRTGPGTGYGRVAAISTGSILYSREAMRNGWIHIQTGPYNGRWACASYLAAATWTRGNLRVTTNGGTLTLRTGPGTQFSRVRSIPNRTVLHFSYKCAGWYYVTYGGQTGWVSGSYIRVISTTNR